LVVFLNKVDVVEDEELLELVEMELRGILIAFYFDIHQNLLEYMYFAYITVSDQPLFLQSCFHSTSFQATIFLLLEARLLLHCRGRMKSLERRRF
jgi:hypothetical protein